MANCPQFVIWGPVPPGSRFVAQASSDGTDYNAGIRIVPEVGPSVQWVRADLDPGPKALALDRQGYGCRVVVTTGASATKATAKAWIEAPDGKKLFQCEWTLSNPNAQLRATIAVVPMV